MDFIDFLKSVLIPIIVSIVTFIFTNIFYLKAKEKKEEKMKIFKILMSTRNMMDYERVKALNSLEVVFYDAPEVLSCWKEYHNSLTFDHEPTQKELEKSSDNSIKLLESIARHLDYKDKVTWDIIKNPYLPKWLSDNYQKLASEKELIRVLPNFINQYNSLNIPNNSSKRTLKKK